MTITLYDCATAPSPRRARILLAEKGIAHETVQVDLRAGEQLGEAFRAINPLCTVPALRTDEGAMLTDNAAIIAWAEAFRPDPPLLGTTPLDKAEVASWHWRAEFEGLLAVEMFLEPGGRLLVNELAPRPHNSGHWTIDGCTVSQFEQQVRAILDLPLGDTTPLAPCVMQNLLGDAIDAWPAILAEPGACLHLYGKREARPGRKMGHVTRFRR